MSMTAIPLQFEKYLQNQISVGDAPDMNEMIFAYIPDLDLEEPIDRASGLPDVAYWVHQQDIDQVGKLGDNALVYSVIIPGSVAAFTFNAIYLRDKNVPNSCGMVVHKADETKEDGMASTKSLMQQYTGAAQIAGINVDAETWQIDYQARLIGIEEDMRLVNLDNYGHTSFVDGFDVTQQADPTKYAISAGVAYIGGLRAVLDSEVIQTVNTLPNGLYVDVVRSGTVLSKWENIVTISLSEVELSDYVDENGDQHYVAKLADLAADGSVTDSRAFGGKWGGERTLSLQGDVEGSAQVDGSDDVAIDVTVNQPRWLTNPPVVSLLKPNKFVEAMYGDATFSRNTESTADLVSGDFDTLDVDKPAYTKHGWTFFGVITNLLPQSESGLFVRTNESTQTVTDNVSGIFEGMEAQQVDFVANGSGSNWYLVQYPISVGAGNYTYIVDVDVRDATVIDEAAITNLTTIYVSSSSVGTITERHAEKLSSTRYRITVKLTITVDTTAYLRVQVAASCIDTTVANTLYSSRVMFIAGDKPNAPYIKTSGSAVARGGDSLTIPAKGNFPTYTGEMTISVDIYPPDLSSSADYPYVLALGSATYGSGACRVWFNNPTSTLRVVFDTVSISIPYSALSQNKKNRLILTVSQSGVSVYVDGVHILSSTTPVDLSDIYINRSGNGFVIASNSNWSAHYLENFQIYPYAFTEAEARAMGAPHE
ncbi:phage tail protein [Vibrio parahaemolyticus]|nr:phage tail protein [Vibrio parahaemolyticus]MDN4711599.1 phage tail protein [Vibrio parahaemolyticus]